MSYLAIGFWVAPDSETNSLSCKTDTDNVIDIAETLKRYVEAKQDPMNLPHPDYLYEIWLLDSGTSCETCAYSDPPRVVNHWTYIVDHWISDR